MGNASKESSGLLADRAYLILRERILKLELQPGSAINEDDLVNELGVGRTPIREAIKRLSLEGLIAVYPRRGTFVTDINITDLGSISELRRRLEGYASEKAAQAPEKERLRTQELIDEIAQASSESENAEFLMELDERAHRLIYELSGNHFLASTALQYYSLSARIWNLVRSRLSSVGETVEEQRDILTSVRDGDPDAARERAEAHVANFANRVYEVL